MTTPYRDATDELRAQVASLTAARDAAAKELEAAQKARNGLERQLWERRREPGTRLFVIWAMGLLGMFLCWLLLTLAFQSDWGGWAMLLAFALPPLPAAFYAAATDHRGVLSDWIGVR